MSNLKMTTNETTKYLEPSDTTLKSSVAVESIDRDTLFIPHKYEFLADLGFSENDDIYFRLLPAKNFDASNPEHRDIFPKLWWTHEDTDKETGEVTLEEVASKEKLRYKKGKLYKKYGTKEHIVSSDLTAYFKAKSLEGFCTYIVVNPGGQEDKDITESRVIFWEIDDISKDEQKARFKEYADKWGGAFAIETAKSIHCYIRLDKTLENKDIKPTLQRLIKLMGSDSSVNNPSRLMRVPDFDHIKINGTEVNRFPITVYKSWDGSKASWDQIDAELPIVEKLTVSKTNTGRPVTAYMPDDGKGHIPLFNCISRVHRDAIELCVPIGSRNTMAYSLACDLIGAERYLYSIGQDFTGSSEELYEKYGKQCDTARVGELDGVWERALDSTDGPCLDPGNMQNCIDGWYRPEATKQETIERLEKAASEAWTNKPEQAQILADKFKSVGKNFTEYEWRILTETDFDHIVSIICHQNKLPTEKPVMALVKGCAYTACRSIFERVPEVTDLSECKGIFWLDYLKHEKKATHDTLAIHRVYGSNIRYNTLRMQPEVNGKEIFLDDLKAEMETNNRETLVQGKDEAISSFMVLAKKNSYNPVTEYLDSCKSKLVKDLTAETILLKCFNLNPKMIKPEIWNLYIEYIKRFLIGAVARAYKPGVKHRTVLVLKGDQYVGKSEVFGILAGEWFDDSIKMDSEKDDKLKMNRTWICEWQELESIIGKKSAGTAKSWIASSVDHIRPPYERASKDLPRPSVICASVNELTFLTDTTGNSRYWVVDTGKGYLDLDWLKENRDAIWAYAVDLHESGSLHWFDSKNPEDMALFKLQNELNEDYATVDPWETAIDNHLDGLSQTSMKAVTQCLELSIDKQNKGTESKISRILTNLGWVCDKYQTRVVGERVRLWKPSTTCLTPSIDEEF